MLAALFQSPGVVEVILLLMLLAWLIASAVMTLRPGRSNAAHTERAEHLERQEQRRIHPTMPPAVRAVTGAPRR